jgi:PAS domain S-box-containing protein
MSDDATGPDATGYATQLLNAAPDAIVVVDADSQIVLVNAQAEQLFGYARQELIGAPLERLLPEAQRAAHAGHLRRYFEDPSTRSMGSGLELRGRRKDGEEIPVEVSLSPVQTDGRLLVCAAARDVSERKRIEALAKLNADRLASAVESVEDAIALYDADLRLVLCNSAYRSTVGATLTGPLVGTGFRELQQAWTPTLAFADDTERARFVAERLAQPGQRRASLDVRTADDRRLRVTTRQTAEGGLVETIWDLTDDLRQAEELRQARAAAEAASNAKSEFLSAMSHELRTPLNSILGFAQLLHRDRKEPLSERHRERTGHILKGGNHLLQLIDEILDLSRIEAGRVPISLEPVGVGEVLEEVRATLAPMADRAGVQLAIEPLPPELPDVVADRTRFKQVVMNFGSNAIKYGRRRGRVVVRGELAGDTVRIVVHDDGPGIPAEKQARMFEPFYRAGQETGAIEGTGIGLAISKRLAELMQGDVGFRSTHGIGSEFWIELPAQLAQPGAPAPRPTTSEELGTRLANGEGRRHLVLYVEDNPSNIAFMQDLLADFERVELLTAPTAEIGIELARGRQPAVIIMDINLPGMSGIEATRRLKQWPQTRDIPVIALSAAATPRDTARAADVGFFRYLTKPVEVDKLVSALEELLEVDSE